MTGISEEKETKKMNMTVYIRMKIEFLNKLKPE
jgi:hypothetical protein